MKPVTQLILVLEAGAALALLGAALSGEGALHSNGLHVAKLAHDRIGFTILAVCVFSCLLASVLLARVTRSWSRAEGWGFFVAILLGWLAASAFANAAGLTLNGASAEWISWPAMLWLLGLVGGLALRACDVGRGPAVPAEPNAAPDRGGP
jgi:hypothetical protein